MKETNLKDVLESCRCGHEGCVEEKCPLFDVDCPSYRCKNEMLNMVYELYKQGKIIVT